MTQKLARSKAAGVFTLLCTTVLLATSHGHAPKPAFLLFNPPWPSRFGSCKTPEVTSSLLPGAWTSQASPSTCGPSPPLSSLQASPMDYSPPATATPDKPVAMDAESEVEVGEGNPVMTTSEGAVEVTPWREHSSRPVRIDRQQWASSLEKASSGAAQEQSASRVIEGVAEDEQTSSGSSPRALALWELFRELDRWGIKYDVLDSREALEVKLADVVTSSPLEGQRPGRDSRSRRQFQEQARGMSSKKLREVLGKNGVAAETLALEDKVALEARFVEMMYAYYHRGEHFMRERKPAKEQPPPAVQTPIPSASLPEASSNDEKEAASGVASSRSTDSSRGIFSSLEEAEVWASMLSLEELQVELDFLMVPYSRTRATRGQLARLLAHAIMNDEGYGVGGYKEVPPPPLVSPPRKSTRKAKESRGVPYPSLSPSPSVRRARRLNDAVSAYGGEDELLDIDKAREELRAIFNSMSQEEKEANRAKLAGRPVARSYVEDEDEEDSLGEGIGVMADRAWDAMQQVRTTAADLVAGAVDQRPRRPSSRPSGPRSRSRGRQLASRSANRLGMVAIRSSLNSLIHGLVGAARWSGSGMLPARYVLFFVGILCLLLRRGVGTFVTALFFIRALTGTLQGIIGHEYPEAEEEEEEEEGRGPGLLELVFS